ncbi:AmmeMemoRadiSam system radical SAM enzyme [Candidatus Woesearchaeota archaeon]|nr:AmmeMemoRadiSam system radical SAM enzyme [Candidatus Woesearchaeota archaeon]
MKKAILWKKLENSNVECQACNFRCKIAPDQTGICMVRKNVNGTLYSLVYGSIISKNIDPIEKKPLFHFLPGTRTFSIGTVGCNFKCLFCQNYDISQYVRDGGFITGKETTPKEVVEEAKKYSCESVAYTYNEPAIFVEFVVDTAKLAKKSGLKNVYVTNGYETKEALEKIKGLIDAMNIDLKSFDKNFYMKTCGAVDVEKVLETITNAYNMGFWIEITTLVIPGHNDSDENLRKIAKFISSLDKNIPWHISRFFPMYKMENVPPTPIDTLIKAYKIGQEFGLRYIYIGNVHKEEYESTFCPSCGNTVIERNWVSGEINNKTKNKECPKCGDKIAGIFS